MGRVDSLTADELQPVDLADVAREAIELYDPLAEADRLLIGKLEPAPTSGVKSLLVQATFNLIDNALKHAPGSGAIVIKTGVFDRGVALTVEDSGLGIASAHRARATDRLVRLDTSHSTEGSGLGLSVVAAVARAHGGEVVLEDNLPGLRATVRLSLRYLGLTPQKTRKRSPVRSADSKG